MNCKLENPLSKDGIESIAKRDKKKLNIKYLVPSAVFLIMLVIMPRFDIAGLVILQVLVFIALLIIFGVWFHKFTQTILYYRSLPKELIEQLEEAAIKSPHIRNYLDKISGERTLTMYDYTVVEKYINCLTD